MQPVDDLLSSLRPFLGACESGQPLMAGPDFVSGSDSLQKVPVVDTAALETMITHACGDLPKLCASVIELCLGTVGSSTTSLRVQLMQLSGFLQGTELVCCCRLTIMLLYLAHVERLIRSTFVFNPP